MPTTPSYTVVDNWQKVQELNTTGTRDKFITVAPDGDTYFFKASMYKKKDGKVKDYPTEFWSEIVASQFGEMTELPVLRYDIASYGEILGCISKNMAAENEYITEGALVVAKIDPTFTLGDNYKQNHFLTLVHKSLARYGIPKFKRIVIEMLLFDCIIGNTDRHSENWAVIRNKSQETETINSFLFDNPTLFELILLPFNRKKREYWNKVWAERKSLYQYFKDEFSMGKGELKDLWKANVYRLAPFYDNGSSLGRELNDNRIREMVKPGSQAFYKYFNNGCPDIRVQDNKITFNDTIEYLLKHYPEECSHFIRKHLSKYNKEEFEKLIQNIDVNLPPVGFEKYRLTEQRKQFYVKIIDNRIEFLLSNIPIQ